MVTDAESETAAKEPSLDEWVRHCFDHPFTPGEWEWYHESDAPDCPLLPATAVDYLTRIFSAPVASIGRFDDDQLNQGLWYLSSPGCGGYCSALLEAEVGEKKRIGGIRSMAVLFSELFASRCTDVLSTGFPSGKRPDGRWHVGEISRLNSICYMWWDNLCIWGKPNDPSRQRFDAAVLEVLEQTLALPHVACQEAALHGLGHWADEYPARVQGIVKRYLASVPGDHPLQQYAERAAIGMVQ